MSENIDVDASWDGKGSLDDHRQKAFESLKQSGFGGQSNEAKARKAAKQSPPAKREGVKSDGE